MLQLNWVTFLVLLFFTACKKDKCHVVPENLLRAQVGNNSGIYDQSGRFILLRGVNYNVLGDYWHGNLSIPTTKEFDENDFKLMASYGVNCVRLLFSWSKLEPQRGEYNQQYIQQIRNAIELAGKYNIYILLDMHQDAWGKYVVSPLAANCDKPNKGWDGAPQWATFTDGAPTCTTDGSRESAPAVVHAWQNFWDNKNGIQDACLKAWTVLIAQTAKYSNVVGYDLINEPSLGYKPIHQEADKLAKFYKKMINTIRNAEQEANAYPHIIFFEMSVTWNGQPIPFIPMPNFTSDDNIIFAPHHYFESISNLLSIEQGVDLLTGLSSLFKTATFIGEFGFFGNPASDVNKYKRFAQKEDAAFISSTWWQWAQAPGDPHAISWDGTQYESTSMHLIELDKNGNFTGEKNEYYLNVLSRTRPMAVFGTPKIMRSNSDNGEMHLEAIGTTQGVTTVWIPDRFGEPIISGVNVAIDKLVKTDGGYIAFVKIQGSYSIDVRF
jgi:endoglycosylceramidase